MGHLKPDHSSLDGKAPDDPRGLLIERILATEPFLKSHRLTSLLQYLADVALSGRTGVLTEQQIGIAVFGKAPGYSPTEDSAVRVQVRQLRLRLHEYFAKEGQNESLLVQIPKGSYGLVFEDKGAAPGLQILPAALHAMGPSREQGQPRLAVRVLSILLCVAVAAAVFSAAGWRRAVLAARPAPPPWPLNAVIQDGVQTRIVVSDGSSMLRLLHPEPFSLEDYARPDFVRSLTPTHMTPDESRLVNYVAASRITSYADTLLASTITRLAGSHAGDLALDTARDLNRRDMEHGNFIFVGGPTSTPWVSLFADKQNFKVVEDGVGGPMYFLNRSPLPGEAATYEGLRYTGSGDNDYATITVLPGMSGEGSVMILEGIREEGTEALGLLLSDERLRSELRSSLQKASGGVIPRYFEALIRARTVAGAPMAISVVSVRALTP